MIKPEIGKLSKSLVDRIPLVMYIPPPPSDPNEKVTPPEPAYSYPPKPAAHPTPSSPTPAPQRPRFKFIRRFGGKKRKGATDSPTQSNDDTPKESHTWEANWEKGEYPFVVLEGNRAACAICLMDFEEPKRIGGPISSNPEPPAETTVPYQTEKPDLGDIAAADEVHQTIIEEGRNDNLRLESAGEGAQPLRLLACGHVFHVRLALLLKLVVLTTLVYQKTCLDPWLTDVSGRCPVCQRAVELPGEKNSRNDRRPH
jgi:hypothetical protein